MRSFKAVALSVLVVASLFAQNVSAQEKNPLKGNEQAAIIPVKTLSGDAFNRLTHMLGVFNVRIQGDAQLRTILVYASPDVIAQIKKVVEELDRPGSEAAIGRNIEMTLTLLRAGMKPTSDAGDLPADMEAVAKQLRAATPYKHVEVWDTIPLRLQEGKQTDQTLRLPGMVTDVPSAPHITANLRILPEAVIRKDSGRFVRFERFTVTIRIPYSTTPKNSLNLPQWQILDLALNTAGDFKEGQKTVLGKLSGAEDESTVFAVISLKVLD